jgi:hypothetical protein
VGTCQQKRLPHQLLEAAAVIKVASTLIQECLQDKAYTAAISVAAVL